jgi:uncharacterized membrane protein YjgN (DUF898 family)
VEGSLLSETPPMGDVASVAFAGHRRALIGIVLKNLALNSLTLGTYRFWAKTRLRRFFWSGITIDGEPLEYIGKGSELFIGFLIVLAILVPYYLATRLIDLLAAGGSTAAQIGVQAVHLAVLGFLIEIAIFRARRYRLTRTLWRAVRFGQDGSALGYAAIALAQRMLALLTFGLTEPWRTTVLQRRLITATRFGDSHFSFDGHAARLMRWYLPAWFMFWLTIAATFLANAEVAASLAKTVSAYEVSRTPPSLNVAPVYWPLAGLAVAWLLYARYRVRQFRYFADSTSLGATTAASGLKTLKVLGYAAVYGLLNLAWLAVLAAIFGAIVADAAGGAATTVPLLVAFAVVLWFTSPIIRIAWLLYPIVRECCRTLQIRNLRAVEGVVQSRRAAPQHGEGLADALDVGGL